VRKLLGAWTTGPIRWRLGFAEGKQALLEPDAALSRDEAELLRAYRSVSSPKLKKQALEIVKTLSQNATNE